jgi:hypothetical protein
MKTFRLSRVFIGSPWEVEEHFSGYYTGTVVASLDTLNQNVAHGTMS